MGRAVGIDLGTSYSCVASMVDGVPIVAEDTNGARTQSSMVSFLPSGKILVGNAAKARRVIDPANTIASAKRLIGRSWFDVEVRRVTAESAVKLLQGDGDVPRYDVRGRQYAIPEIASMVLLKMKSVAEAFYQETVDRAVITCPANFNDSQRQSTRDAGTIAGTAVLRLLNEPTAAALAYGFGKPAKRKLAVYDFGGGTFDLTILQQDGTTFRVLGTAGDTLLGGDDIDDLIAQKLCGFFLQTSRVDLTTDPVALTAVHAAAEQSKIALSTREAVEVRVPKVAQDGSGRPIDLVASLTRQDVEQLAMEHVARSFRVCDEALAAAGLRAKDLDELVLAGGTTKMPLVKQGAEAYFGKRAAEGVSPDEAIATGAAILAAQLTGDADDDDVARDVPLGKSGAVLLDVTPMTLSLGTVGGWVEPIVPRNTPVPAELKRLFVNSRDFQTEARIPIFQGEGREAKAIAKLGELTLDIQPLPRGEAKIEVIYEVDPDGLLRVRAQDVETGAFRVVEVKVQGSLTPDEVAALAASADETRDAVQ